MGDAEPSVVKTKNFFRLAVLWPIPAHLVICLWELRLWQNGPEAATNAFGIRAAMCAKSWLLMGGAQSMISAAAVLAAIDRMRSRAQVQLLFALSPMIFFLIGGAISLLENLFINCWGASGDNARFAAVLLAVATLTLGSIYVFVMNSPFLGLRRMRAARGVAALRD